MASGRLQLTYAMFKPTTTVCPKTCQDITKRILARKFYIVKKQELQMTPEMAAVFYGEHKGKKFYATLMSYMTSGPIVAHVLARENAIKEWRDLMGPTRVYKGIFEKPDCIRSLYGLTDTRNATHGADAVKTARREIGILFPDFDCDKWLKENESKFLEGKVNFNEKTGTHS